MALIGGVTLAQFRHCDKSWITQIIHQNHVEEAALRHGSDRLRHGHDVCGRVPRSWSSYRRLGWSCRRFQVSVIAEVDQASESIDARPD